MFIDTYFPIIFLQVESDGSRSGSSLSLRNMSGATTNASGGTHGTGNSGGGAGVTSQSPSHGSSNSGSSSSHNRVQRSISATSSKPRRGSTGAQDSNSGRDPPPSAAPRVNNNIQSNFKRQNTVDTATIKENTPRYSGSRPATATAATSKTPTTQGKISGFFRLSLKLSLVPVKSSMKKSFSE